MVEINLPAQVLMPDLEKVIFRILGVFIVASLGICNLIVGPEFLGVMGVQILLVLNQ